MTRLISTAPKWLSVSVLLLLVPSLALASYCDNAYGLKEVLCNVLGSFGNIADLIGGFAYVMGIAFGVASAFKFKQHRDAPTQVHLGHPIVYLTTSVGLIYLPSLITQSADSAFTSIDENYQKAFVEPSVWTGPQ
tara:strand:+ start:80 stop:484 length:405 start_codon:yes stop_codon:yes gene_type:complete